MFQKFNLNEALILTTDERQVESSKYKKIGNTLQNLGTFGLGVIVMDIIRLQWESTCNVRYRSKPCDILPLIPIIKVQDAKLLN